MQAALKKQGKFTYADYLTWDDDERWELIDGQAYNMSPAPATKHQLFLGELHRQIANLLIEKEMSCLSFVAPFDVRFPENVKDNNKIIDVVQPDISVICNLSRLDEKGCHGAPDFIIEVLSPSTAQKDYEVKRQLYEKNGVKEYWLVDPTNHIVTVYLLEESGKYGPPLIHAVKGKLKVKSLDEIIIDLDRVFVEYEFM